MGLGYGMGWNGQKRVRVRVMHAARLTGALSTRSECNELEQHLHCEDRDEEQVEVSELRLEAGSGVEARRVDGQAGRGDENGGHDEAVEGDARGNGLARSPHGIARPKEQQGVVLGPLGTPR